MQVCLFNSTNQPIFIKEIGMTVGAKQKSRVLQEFERIAIVNEYPGLLFVNVLLEEKSAAKPVEIETEHHEIETGEGDGTRTKRKTRT